MEDVDCVLCMMIMVDPVTITCGHTFCQQCIRRQLLSQPKCPVCRVNCFIRITDLQINKILHELIKKHHTDRYNERIKELEETELEDAQEEAKAYHFIEGDIPVMIVQEVIPFPGVEFQIFAGEQRYIDIIIMALNDSNHFSLISVNGNLRMGSIVEIVDNSQLEHNGSVVVRCKSRFRTDSVYQAANTAVRLPIDELPSALTDIQNLYMCTPQPIDDTTQSNDREIPEELQHFMRTAVDRLGSAWRNRLQQIFTNCEGDISFLYCAFLLFSEPETQRAFESSGFEERVSMCMNFIKDKTPTSRALRIPGSAKSSLMDSPWVLVVIAAAVIYYLLSK